MGKFIIIAALVASVGAASTLPGCSANESKYTVETTKALPNGEGIITKKTETATDPKVYNISVDYEVDGLSSSIDYRVTENYYNSVKVGDIFVYNEEDIAGNALDEVDNR